MTSPARAKQIPRACSPPFGWPSSWPGTSEGRAIGRARSTFCQPGSSTLALKLAPIGQSFLLAAALTSSLSASSLPAPSLNPKLQAPIKTWDEAIPLGNGLMGGLVWGENNILRLSLDRGDLWDERPSKHRVEVHDRFNWATMQRLVAEDRMAEFNDIFDSNYDYDGPPTKLPAGRLEIAIDSSQSIETFELSLATAEAIARLKDGSEIRAFISAAKVREPVAILRIPGPAMKDLRLRPPDSVKKLHYPPARSGHAGSPMPLDPSGPLTPSLSPSDGERVPFRAGEG